LRTRATTTRLAIAIVGSLALHALLMSSVRLDRAAPPQPEAPPLEARLEPAPPPTAKPAPVATPARKPRTRRVAANPPVPPVRVVNTAPPLFVPPELELGPVPELEEAPVTAAEPVPADAPVVEPESVAAVSENPLPPRGRIEYIVLYGSGDGLPVGKVVHSWKMKNGRYLLASDAETTGLVDLFSPQRLRYVSQGTITPQGLRPDSFFITRTRRGKTEAARALFDWDKGQILYGYARDRKTAALTKGTQDLMTLAYQFTRVPAPGPGHLQVPVTSGKDFDTYDVEVFPEEVIDTPIGQLRTLPVKQIARPGKEHFEIWLAVRYNYLPVRICHYDRKGSYSGQQIAVEIRVGDNEEMASR
jgi:Protein of unknown function (DUF3108)